MPFFVQILFIPHNNTLETGKAHENQRIVAYYQNSGKNKIATRAVLQLFRWVYPNASLYMHFDTNESVETRSLANEFGAGLVTYSNRLEFRSSDQKGLYFTVGAGIQFIQRLQAAASLQPDGWVMLLEDDVWTLSLVNTKSDLFYDISGMCWLTFDKEHSRIIRTHAFPRQVYMNATCYGANGGSFINSSRLLGLNTSNQDLLAFMRHMTARGGDIASDLLLSSVILWDGGAVGPYHGFYDFVVVGHGLPKTVHHMKLLYVLRHVYG